MIAVAERLHTVEEYYFSRKLREVRELVAKGRPVINMGIGSPDLPPSEEVIEALTASLHEGVAHQYQSYQGIPALREAMADFYSENFNARFDPSSEILPLMGSKEGIMHISMAFLNEGDQVLIPDPGYPTYSSVSRLVGAEPRYYMLSEDQGWLPDLEALEKEDLSAVKLMWINYPHMPTGAKADARFFSKLIDFAEKHEILLVNDNPYSFVLNDTPATLFVNDKAKKVGLELNSLSKTFNMAGWRVGMLMGSPENISSVLKVKSNMDSGMFYGIQKGAVVALKSGKEWFTNLDEIYGRRRKLIHQLADMLGCSYDKDAAGMFVWAKLPSDIPSAEQFIDEVLYKKDIFITPGTVFGSMGEGYIRFSLCVNEDRIKEAISRFKDE
ncbi:aminotransferase class I/II-fold pyridoxal phosphate-dependent enzyme [Leptobacterium flavescens]|uniref:Aminotransferase n=1 Tax=Leptobacterium flavescens TaxID=472055 RepID=A0A6P0UIZ3_9FLAO|nr:aminotransferase class I/II-fold pyridoxal phosphate-dependent enzyme [Leptobacterium flavescens]NER12512.1 aminotransferase class I/II-fold pyridoxal phosphate-dependent enzyme [Leptobacterium flavescens]